MYVYLLNPPADRPMIREGRCQSPGNMRSTSVPQLSLAYIATSLRRSGAEVALVDAIAENWSVEDVDREFRRRRPDLLVVNTTTPTIQNDVTVLRELKQLHPDLPFIVFGAHATATHRALLETHDFLDAAVRGEPELTIRELAERHGRGESWVGTAGATVRADDGSLAEGPERKMVQKLDELGWPARDLLPHHHYIHPLSGERYTTINVGRGCPQQCIFCVAPIYYGRPLRFRTPDDVVREIREDVIGRHGIRYLWFYADDLTANVTYLKDLCRKIIDAKLDIRWWGNTRADLQDQELFDLMAQAGCMMLSIGGESGSDTILENAKKGCTAEDIKITVKMLRKAGITSLVYFIIGLPGETRETVAETIAFSKKANPDYVEFYPATPYPGTEFRRVAESHNLITSNDWDRYECGGTRFVVKVADYTPEELDRQLREAYRQYYFRWGYMRPRILREVRNPKRLAKLARFGVEYFGRLRVKRDDPVGAAHD